VAIIVLAATAVSTNQLFVPLERGATNAGSVLGTVGLQWDYLYRHEPEADVQLRWLPMVEYVNSHLAAGRSKIYDLANMNGYYMYIRPELFSGDGYGSPTVMRQWSLASPNVLSELIRNRITDVVVRKRYLSTLKHEDVWPHLHLTYRSPDGLVLFHVMT